MPLARDGRRNRFPCWPAKRQEQGIVSINVICSAQPSAGGFVKHPMQAALRILLVGASLCLAGERSIAQTNAVVHAVEEGGRIALDYLRVKNPPATEGWSEPVNECPLRIHAIMGPTKMIAPPGQKAPSSRRAASPPSAGRPCGHARPAPRIPYWAGIWPRLSSLQLEYSIAQR